MTVKTGAGVSDAPAAIILNPTAGAGRGRRARPLLETAAAASSPRPRLLTTTGPGDATALARRCVEEGAGLVIAAGGDGTAHEVVQGLLEAAGVAGTGGESPPPTFGYVPLGTGCDLAIALGLPREPRGLLEGLLGGSDARIDIGLLEVDGAEDGGDVDVGTGPGASPRVRRWFLNAANVGLGPVVAERVAASRFLRTWGTPAYLLAAARALVRTTPEELGWETDEGRAGRGPVVNLSVCNGPSFGGGMRPCPDAALTSGLLHVALVRPLGLLAAMRQIPRLMRGRRLDHPSIDLFSCREMRVWSGREGGGSDGGRGVPVEVDGEISGPLPVRLRVVPGGLAVRLPRGHQDAAGP